MFTNMIMPALAARFFIYFLDLPQHFTVGGVEVSTFHLLMLVVLTLAIFIIWVGGSISINITDTIQGFFCYPMLVVMVIYILYKYPWGEQILPVRMDKIPGESMINPTDIERLRDFNLFSVLALPFITRFLQRVSWFGGGGSSTAARSAHEQKMAGLLGIRAIGRASDVGTLEMICKSRGPMNTANDILSNMIGDGYKGGRVKLHHANNPASAELLKTKILEKFPEAKIDIGMTGGLCSFYAEQGGILVGFEV